MARYAALALVPHDSAQQSMAGVLLLHSSQLTARHENHAAISLCGEESKARSSIPAMFLSQVLSQMRANSPQHKRKNCAVFFMRRRKANRNALLFRVPSLRLRPCLSLPAMTCLPVLLPRHTPFSLITSLTPNSTHAFASDFPSTSRLSIIHSGDVAFACHHPWRWGFLPAWSCSSVVKVIVVIKT